MEQFERANPRADESIRSIRPELAEAVDKCVDAAGMESEPYWQKRLLKVSRGEARGSIVILTMW